MYQSLKMLAFVLSAFVLYGVLGTEVEIELVRDPLGCRYAHNVVRSRHGVNNVTWDDDLAYDAESYALHLAKTNTFVHSSMDGYGENLYAVWGLKSPTYCNTSVHAWYSEISSYDYDNPSFSEQTGHFTQLVWDDLTKIGVGSVYDPTTENAYVVARYVPRGNENTDGGFAQHVPEPLPGTTTPSIADLSYPYENPYISGVDIDEDGSNSQPCEDVVDCTYYVSQGDCTNSDYQSWMKDNCYESCKYCTPGPPVDGGWSDWIDMEDCTTSCNVLQQRFCINPEPSNGGKNCTGEDSQTISCTGGSCDPSCMDSDTDCPIWEELGYCDPKSEYSAWMEENCLKSCDVCTSTVHDEL